MPEDPNTLFEEAKCFRCNSDASLSDLLKLALLQRIAEAGGGGGGTPGGAASSVQFNDAGAFGGFGSFNSGTSVLTIPGDLLFNTDNTNPIGGAAANRPSVVNAGTSVNAPIFLGGNGALGAPTYSFASETNLGIYRVGALRIGFVTNGNLRGEFNNSIFELKAAVPLSFNSSTFLRGDDAANEVAQRNGASAQSYKLYRTFTNSTNYERLSLHSAANEMIVAAETAGTGGDNIDLGLTAAGTGRVKINTALNTAVDGGLTAAFTANMVGSTGGPTTAAQNGWVELKDSTGANIWVPVWK